jgi:hypothetical protein
LLLPKRIAPVEARPPACGGLDALADGSPLELGEGTRDVEEQLAGGRCGVDVLLRQVEVDAPLCRCSTVPASSANLIYGCFPSFVVKWQCASGENSMIDV